jgi:hypothetical protein
LVHGDGDGNESPLPQTKLPDSESKFKFGRQATEKGGSPSLASRERCYKNGVVRVCPREGNYACDAMADRSLVGTRNSPLVAVQKMYYSAAWRLVTRYD